MTENRRPSRLLVAHPSPDLYGSDRQLVVTIEAAMAAGWAVSVFLPERGPLSTMLQEQGVRVETLGFPVLRRAVLTPAGFARFALATLIALTRLVRLLRRLRPDLVLVNTLTIPVWLVAARFASIPVMCHVHEAEENVSLAARRVLTVPLVMARTVVANSGTTERVLRTAIPFLHKRITMIHNGVPGPQEEVQEPRRRDDGEQARLAVVSRLSPRKGIHVALEAVAMLRGEGRDVMLSVCGTPYVGYEWYEEKLRERAASADISGSISFLGYVSPTWRVLGDADVVLVPSFGESFGNVAVEAMAARRPVVVTGTQGLLEIVEDGQTGLIAELGSPESLARSISILLDDPELGRRIAEAGHREATTRFSTDRYAAEMCRVLNCASGRG